MEKGSERGSVLITGAASGIGQAAARLFASHGYTVWALDRDPVTPEEGILPLTCDVTDAEGLRAVYERLAAEGVTLRAILPIAGIHRMISLVESSAASIRRLTEVNLIGTMLTVQAFHPLLAPRGRVVIVTSEVATYDPLPFNGLYTVTKNALECYAQALRQEIGLLGQHVVTVRPGAVATPITDGTVMGAFELANSTSLYLREAHRFTDLTERFQGKPITPEALAPTILRAATARRPRLSYARHRHPGLILLSALPKRLQCAIVRGLLHRR